MPADIQWSGLPTKWLCPPMAMTRHKPVARIQRTRINRKPKEAEHGAERLATPNAQGIYRRSLLGSNFRDGHQGRGSIADLGRGKCGIGRDARHREQHGGAASASNSGKRKAKVEHFEIPKRFMTGH
ncbi:hypothetical protein BJV77DRAFT_99832 [Russula vinacea]|nr:hypothetical protein BJV77DRAFT_99832 [Russula vinacea]